jgi:chaperonin GroES
MKHVTTQDRVVVRPEQKDNRTASGLIIPDLEQATTTTGVVVAVGPGRKTKKDVVVEVAVAVGDRIMFTTGTGISIKTDGEDYVILKEDEIIGVVENE